MKLGGLQYERAVFLRWYDNLLFASVRVIALIAAMLSVLVILFVWAGILPIVFEAASLILLGPSLAIVSFHLYVIYVRHNPSFLLTKSSAANNPLNGFDYMGALAMNALVKKQSYTAFWRILLDDPSVKHLVYRLELSEENLLKLFEQVPYKDEDADWLLQQSSEIAGKELIDRFIVFEAMLSHPVTIHFLSTQKLPVETVKKVVQFYRLQYQLNSSSAFWLPENQSRSGGFGKSWATSYTNFLDRFTEELTPQIAKRNKYLPLVGRSDLIKQSVVELMKANGHNLMLLGEDGVGRSELFYHLAGQILTYQTKSELDGMQVRILQVQSLLAAASSNDLEAVFQALFGELVKAGNVILYIPDIGLFFDTSAASGTADISHLISDYLTDSRIKVIGSITPERYTTLVRSRPDVSEQFSSLEVRPPTPEETEIIMIVQLPAIENRYKVFVPLQALQSLAQLSGRYLKDKTSPTRELDLLEEVAAFTHGNNRQLVTPEDVSAVVEQKAKVPLQVNEKEQSTLLNLEAELHKRVIGQNRAVKLVSDALLRARAGLTKGDRPIGSFLFLGPTGVGKTETAKALAAIYFGSADKLIRLDMTEYADSSALTKLLGSDPVNQPGALTIAIQQQPSSVVLLDELERASEQVKNVLLQLLDEGRLTTNSGKLLDFTNTIVIATSNAGSDIIKSAVEQGKLPETFDKQLVDTLITNKIYRPEFLNRFDGVVVYLPLSQSEIKEVVGLQLASLKQIVHDQKGLELEIAQPVIDELSSKGYDPVFGARALQRVIKNDLETAIAREIVSQNPAAGSTLTINSL